MPEYLIEVFMKYILVLLSLVSLVACTTTLSNQKCKKIPVGPHEWERVCEEAK